MLWSLWCVRSLKPLGVPNAEWSNLRRWLLLRQFLRESKLKGRERPWKQVKDRERARSGLAFQIYLHEVVKTLLPPMHLWFRFMHAIAPWLNNWRGRPVLFQEELRQQQSLPTKGMKNIAGQQYLKTARPSCRLKSVSLERKQENDRKGSWKEWKETLKTSNTMGDSNESSLSLNLHARL